MYKFNHNEVIISCQDDKGLKDADVSENLV